MRVGVYVDGFNLYYGIRRFEPLGRNYRWLDLLALSQRLLSRHEIVHIRYFTARVDGRRNPSSPRRQDLYIRALRSIPCLTVHEGEFQTGKKRMMLVDPGADEPEFVNVWRTEEKGSDVSLAAHLLVDGFRDRYDLAAIITNDSDLVEPVRLARLELDRPIGVFNPQSGFSSRLNKAATFYTQIDEADFATAQFPEELTDQNGRGIAKPAKWNPTNESA